MRAGCFGSISLILSLLALFAGCDNSDSNGGGAPRACNSKHPSFLPEPTGPYCVGTKSMALQDVSRDETFTADPNDRREMMVHLFYPVAPGTTGRLAPYTDAASFEYLVTDYWSPLSPHPDYQNLLTHSLLDAPLAGGEGAFPLLLASPGLGSMSAALTTTIETLASNGYIVAAIDHPYVSGRTVFPDGRVISRVLAPNEEFSALRAALPVVVADQRFVLDEIVGLATSDPAWRGRIDLTRIGAFGHSYGGNTAAELCVDDDRTRACLNYDGLFLGDIGKHGSAKPIMAILRNHRYLLDPPFVDNTIVDLIAHQSGPLHLAEIEGAEHNGLTDAGFFFDLFPLPEPIEPFIGTLSPARTLEIVNAYTRAFFAVYLLDQPESMLTGLALSFPEVQFATP